MADASAYHKLKLRWWLASIAANLAFLSVFSSPRISGTLLEYTADPLSGNIGALVFVSSFYFLWQAALLPIRIASGWLLEKRFSMTKQAFGGWFADHLKSLALGWAFFAASALIFYATLRLWPANAWWILAALTFAFSAVFSTLFPVWILPMFHRTTPLTDAGLVSRLKKAAARCGYPELPLLEIKLGDKTVRANAMLTGFGRTRRALFSDTLLASYTPAEIEMVLAHEAGHHALSHLRRSIVLEAALAAAAFFGLFRLFDAATLAELSFFPALAALSYLAGLAAMPLHNGISRSYEREADRFALTRYRDYETFRSLMDKLSEQNLGNPSPGRVEEFFLYTHPSKRRRLAHAESFVRACLANSARAV